jgi:hypothetical protein
MIPKNHAALIFALSVLFVMMLYFVDESTYSLAPLLSWNEFGNFCLFVVVNSVASLALYSIMLSTAYKRKSLTVALVAYVPVVGLIVWNLVE